MSFFSELVSDFVSGGQPQQQQQRPQVPYPWQARWDNEQGRWVFVNEQTGERTFDQASLGLRNEVQNDEYRFDNDVRNDVNRVEDAPEDAAMWAGRKVQDIEDAPEDVANWAGRKEQDFDNDVNRFDNRVESRFDNAVNDVEDAPENVAGWLGRKIQDVEDIPQDIKGDFERPFQRVDQKIDNAEGDIRRFDQSVESSYDQGREEGMRDDRW
ncbi:hypothetical protein K432DRAFT_440883 [Lepidopterella palustris CBS 459.81]|uniref:WW domain-containing protein n=1 Tax=Lepidopterella palustris CBS 459.81 TaxID=1314670 RepID=A0A8E2EG32_9PEZI|nr:hypothetical protein K432DRAFT_440883 [Lepidopterella palustris CBS 459.81]